MRTYVVKSNRPPFYKRKRLNVLYKIIKYQKSKNNKVTSDLHENFVLNYNFISKIS